MKRLVAAAFFLCAISHAEDPSQLLNSLPQGTLQSAFQILRRDYIRRDELTFEELNRAALQGLLERLNFSAKLVPLKNEVRSAKPSVHAEFLAPDIAYLRPETFDEGEPALFEKELAKIAEQKAQHLILDLRVAATGGSFDAAAQMLQCFISQGALMFKMKQIGRDDAELFISKRDPLWKGPVVVLIDAESGNAAEAVAACLKHQGRALFIGETTRGAAVGYTEVKLDDKVALRYASAEMMLPDGSTIFKKGIEPRIMVRASAVEKHQVFKSSRGSSMKPFVNDRVRPRFNEAALVGMKNPELDDYVRRGAGQALPGDEGQVRDVVTQRALDFLRAGDFTGAAKLKWAAPAEPQKSTSGPATPKAEPAKP